ncbi:phosphopentomutase [Pseudohalocynthiibacter sp. F2068]|jgi:phosphopentomutase|uniref:phosphopentomutase n=1 Tax=Pseudohalocynthiibacter sp. F2068 TaxID=2926418 RepID=UPI001FF2B53A|nr:phosphopentomutase [Pseudohalocynthiibacter sp. F2068]MCK0103968.1 phosphopentomutase [Pseudohalocynthiibacter sp. F2068]
MSRAFLVVLDSVGCGGAPDATAFGDEGANTLAHIAQACAAGQAEEGRSGPLHLPNLDALGLGAAIRLASGEETPGLQAEPTGLWGAATEVSKGKDTPSGHWEIAGVPVPWDWHYFPRTDPVFPEELLLDICVAAGVGGTLGNRHDAGTAIIAEQGARHMKTGWPICYTSADSVLQIAAHEEIFGLERLLKLCQDIAPQLHAMKVGRVIARPFIGSPDTGFTRTTNRRDFAIPPPSPTLCNWVQDAGGHVYAIGKIGDIFSMQGIDEVRKGSDEVLMKHLFDLLDDAEGGSLTFANFVEFDSKYGHRRDVSGYARALEGFDARVPTIISKLRPDDLLLFTADHGNDPTWRGTDHTRERVPVLGYGVGSKAIGLCGFSDIGVSVATHLGVQAKGPGRSFL